MCKPALLIQPEIGLLGQFAHAPLRKEIRRNAFCRGFIGDMLRAFFAKFEVRTLAVGLRPGAAGTINSSLLIQL
jgi:hypothetical protein